LQPPFSNLQLLAPLKFVNLQSNFRSPIIGSSNGPYKPFAGEPFSRIPSEEFVLDDFVLDGAGGPKVVQNNLKSVKKDLGRTKNAWERSDSNFQISTGHGFYPSSYAYALNALNSERAGPCPRYLRQLHPTANPEIIKSLCKQVESIYNEGVGDEDSVSTGYHVHKDIVDDGEAAHVHRGVGMEGFGLDNLLHKMLNGATTENKLYKLDIKNLLGNDERIVLGNGNIDGRADRYHDALLAKIQRGATNGQVNDNDKIIIAGHILSQTLDELKNLNFHHVGNKGNYVNAGNKGTSRDSVLTGGSTVFGNLHLSKGEISNRINATLDKGKNKEEYVTNNNRDQQNDRTLANGGGGKVDTEHHHRCTVMCINLCPHDPNAMKLVSESLLRQQQKEDVAASTPVPYDVGKFRPPGGRREWLTMGGQKNKK
jgi:hypothetical protein